MYYVYIIYSESTSKYYTGQTNNLNNRIRRHNSGLSKSTKSGLLWKLIYQIEFHSRSEAMQLDIYKKKEVLKDT
jgi:putative endonuclease